MNPGLRLHSTRCHALPTKRHPTVLTSLFLNAILLTTVSPGSGLGAGSSLALAAEIETNPEPQTPLCRLFPESSSTLYKDVDRSRLLLQSEQPCDGISGSVGRVLLIRTTSAGETRIRANLLKFGGADDSSLHQYMIEAELAEAPEGFGTFTVALDDGEQEPKVIGAVSLAIETFPVTVGLDTTYLDPVLDELVVAHPPKADALVVDPLGMQDAQHHLLNVVSLSAPSDFPLDAPLGYEWEVESSSASVGVCTAGGQSQALECSGEKVKLRSIRRIRLHARKRVPTELLLHLTLVHQSESGGTQPLKVLRRSVVVAQEATLHSLPVPIAQAAYVTCPSRRSGKGTVRVARQSTVDAARDSLRENECRLVITRDEYLHQVAQLHGIPSRLKQVRNQDDPLQDGGKRQGPKNKKKNKKKKKNRKKNKKKNKTQDTRDRCAHEGTSDYWKGEYCLVWGKKGAAGSGLDQQTRGEVYKAILAIVRDTTSGETARVSRILVETHKGLTAVIPKENTSALEGHISDVKAAHSQAASALQIADEHFEKKRYERFLQQAAVVVTHAEATRDAATAALDLLAKPTAKQITVQRRTADTKRTAAHSEKDEAKSDELFKHSFKAEDEANAYEAMITGLEGAITDLSSDIDRARIRVEIAHERLAAQEKSAKYEQATIAMARLHGPQKLAMYVQREGESNPEVVSVAYSFSSTARRFEMTIPIAEPVLDPSKTYEVRLLNRTALSSGAAGSAGAPSSGTLTSEFDQARFVGRIRSRGAFGWPSSWRGNSIRAFVTVPANVAGMKFPASPAELRTSEDTTTMQLSTLDTGVLLAVEPWNYRYATNPLVLSPLLATGFLFRGFSTAPDQLTRSRPLWVLGPQLRFPLNKGDNQRDIALALGLYWSVDLRQPRPVQDGSHLLITFGVDVLSLFGAASADDGK